MFISKHVVCLLALAQLHIHVYVGPLSSVDLEIEYSNATSITIAWNTPSSLNVTGVDLDIWYSVLIYNGTDNWTLVPCTDCNNLTETHYTFSPDYPSTCHEYAFTVIPYNGAGQGEMSHNASANIGSEFRSCICMYLLV